MRYTKAGITLLTLGLFFGTFFVVHAQGDDSVQYPIRELGDCSSKQECKTYCEDESNKDSCLSFAEENGLISKEDAKRMKDFREEARSERAISGPGGCSSRGECESYCSEESNRKECLDYSVKEGYISKEQAERVLEKVEKGGPGGCKSEKECKTYCENPDNTGSCLDFVVSEGRITPEEAQFLKEQMTSHRDREDGFGEDDDRHEEDIDEESALRAIEEHGGPGGCSNIQECEAFCGDSQNQGICMDYAIEHGLVSQDQIERFEKIKEFENIEGPGGCVGAKECDEYCRNPEHRNSCFDFALKNDLIPQDELDRIEKEMEIIERIEKVEGPGGCSSIESCNSYCSNESNREECSSFSGRNDVMDHREMEDMMDREDFRERFDERREHFEPDEFDDMDFDEDYSDDFYERQDYREYDEDREDRYYKEEYDEKYNDSYDERGDNVEHFQEGFGEYQDRSLDDFEEFNTDESYYGEDDSGYDGGHNREYDQGFDNQYESESSFDEFEEFGNEEQYFDEPIFEDSQQEFKGDDQHEEDRHKDEENYEAEQNTADEHSISIRFNLLHQLASAVNSFFNRR